MTAATCFDPKHVVDVDAKWYTDNPKQISESYCYDLEGIHLIIGYK
jgi:hypothetical protein